MRYPDRAAWCIEDLPDVANELDAAFPGEKPLVIVIDYLQRVATRNEKAKDERARIDAIMQAITSERARRANAGERGLVTIYLSVAARGAALSVGMKGEDPDWPTLKQVQASGKESGMIETEADLVLGIVRPENEFIGSGGPGGPWAHMKDHLLLAVAKSRLGPDVGWVGLSKRRNIIMGTRAPGGPTWTGQRPDGGWDSAELLAKRICEVENNREPSDGPAPFTGAGYQGWANTTTL